MISAEDNVALTRTGPGTLMGDLFRRYWLPALHSSEIPKPDCAPVRVKLLGEPLIAFRDSEGRVGLLDEFWRCGPPGQQPRALVVPAAPQPQGERAELKGLGHADRV